MIRRHSRQTMWDEFDKEIFLSREGSMGTGELRAARGLSVTTSRANTERLAFDDEDQGPGPIVQDEETYLFADPHLGAHDPEARAYYETIEPRRYRKASITMKALRNLRRFRFHDYQGYIAWRADVLLNEVAREEYARFKEVFKASMGVESPWTFDVWVAHRYESTGVEMRLRGQGAPTAFVVEQEVWFNEDTEEWEGSSTPSTFNGTMASRPRSTPHCIPFQVTQALRLMGVPDTRQEPLT